MQLCQIDLMSNPLEKGALALLIVLLFIAIIWLNNERKSSSKKYLDRIKEKEKETNDVREKMEKDIEKVREKLEKSDNQKLEMTHRVVELSVELLAAIKRFNNGTNFK
ncbi:hypothetical protein Cycma_0232 [Cyclobacterium marinum DSM 745]|uniref:Uncharacterized protein n=2 Tax=Cyclobacterium marinum TaxID=104 RepID=G0J373_CYCMS|nr:hypothetical protein Cycma_0232 [Cyclobacterium marinum DSM 745]